MQRGNIGGLQNLADRTKKMMEDAKRVQEQSRQQLEAEQEKQRGQKEKSRHKKEAKESEQNEKTDKKQVKETKPHSQSIQDHTSASKKTGEITNQTARILGQLDELKKETPNDSQRTRVQQLTNEVNAIGYQAVEAEYKKTIGNTENVDLLKEKANDLGSQQAVFKKTTPKSESRSRCCFPFSLCFGGEKKEPSNKVDPEKRPLLGTNNHRRY